MARAGRAARSIWRWRCLRPAAGISLTHVPYKGATQAATDVAAGQIPVAFQGLGTVAALVRGGQLRLIGVTTEKRLPQFPDVPTVSESGLPGFFFNSWFAILAPAGTPKDIIARLNAEALKARRRSRGAAQARRAGFCGARQFAGGIGRHDARSTRQIWARDQGNGNRQGIGRRSGKARGVTAWRCRGGYSGCPHSPVAWHAGLLRNPVVLRSVALRFLQSASQRMACPQCSTWPSDDVKACSAMIFR